MRYWRYNDFRLSRDLKIQRNQRVIRLYGQEPIKVSYHLAKFGGHRHCGNDDIMSLVCHVLEYHVINSNYGGLCNGSFGSGKVKLPPSTCLKLVRIMLET